MIIEISQERSDFCKGEGVTNVTISTVVEIFVPKMGKVQSWYYSFATLPHCYFIHYPTIRACGVTGRR